MNSPVAGLQPSMYFAFDNLDGVARFLRFLPQFLNGAKWNPDEIEVLRRTEGERDVRPLYYFNLDAVSNGGLSAQLQRIAADLTPVRFENSLPESVHLESLPSFLEMNFPLCRAPMNWSRHDLLIAVYDQSLLREVFEKVPKNPRQAIDVVYLAVRESQGPDSKPQQWPHCLLTLPQSDPSIHWAQWIESVGPVRRGGEEPLFRLFYGISGRQTNSRYYIEYGYVHPVEQIPDLHRDDSQGLVLLSQRQPYHQNPEVLSSASWVVVSRRNMERSLQYVEPELRGFQFDVERGTRKQLLTLTEPPAHPVRLTAKLVRIAGDNPMPLESLNQQIQITQSRLFRMQRERDALAGRARKRMRYVLTFEQPAAADGMPERLAPAFERFISVSESLLDRFYHSVQTLAESGRRMHVVLTRDSMLAEDLHLGLADECFCQPEDWTAGNFSVYVDHRFELTPRITDKGLKAGFRRAFQAALGDAAERRSETASTVERCLLLTPSTAPATSNGVRSGEEDNEAAFEILICDFSHNGTLRTHLEFLNLSYPCRELESRILALDAFRQQLEASAIDLPKSVQQIEDELTCESERRLCVLRKQWNDLAPRIECGLNLVEHQFDHFAEVEQMITDFSTAWSGFCAKFRDLTESLVADKLALIDELQVQHQGWKTTIEQVDQSHRDLQQDCRLIREDMDERLAASEQERNRTLQEQEQTESHFAATAAAQNTAHAEIDQAVDQGRAHEKSVAAISEKARQKVAAFQDLANRVGQECRTITKNRDRFGGLVSDMRSNLQEAHGAAQETAILANELQALDQEWSKTLTESGTQLDQVRLSARQIEKQNEQTKDRIRVVQEKALQEVNRLDGRLKSLFEQQEAAEKQIRELEAKREEVKRGTMKLKDLREEGDELRRLLKSEEDEREELKTDLEQLKTGFWFERGKRAAELSEALDEVMRDLRTLMKAESSLKHLVEFRRAAKLQADILREYRKSRGLSEKEYADIWS